MSQKELNGRLARWSLQLQPFSFEIRHRKGSQKIVTDTLSRNPVEEMKLNESLIDLTL